MITNLAGIDAESNAKLERLIATTRSFTPSQIHRLDDDHVLVAIPLTAKAVQAPPVAAAVVASEPIPYKDITEVAPQYLAQAIRLGKTFEPAIDRETLALDLGKAVDIVQNNPTMTVVGTLNTTVRETQNKVEVIVDKVLQILLTVFQLALTGPVKEALVGAITSTFTNLSTQEGGTWILFREETATSCTYQYNLLFAIQNEKTGGVMLALPIAYTIRVNKNKQQVLFITLKDSAEYSVEIKGLRVAQILEGTAA